ncbi:MAG: thiamine biosynthesis protein ApbE, partial [Sphingobium sp.]
MGTTWSVRIVDPPADCQTHVEAVLAAVIGEMSNWEAGSDISRFNRSPIGQWTRLPPAMARWGFGPALAGGSATASVAPWTCIELNGDRARRTADVALDFSGIAKGYAVDAVAACLRNLGLPNFLVEIGGELRGEGVKPDIQPWWVDAEVPPGLDLPALRVALCGLSIASSGDYRRYRMEGDRRLSHSIDPATGAPIAEGVAAVTVLHASAMLADAWATAITVLGADRGMALATRHNLAARLI